MDQEQNYCLLKKKNRTNNFSQEKKKRKMSCCVDQEQDLRVVVSHISGAVTKHQCIHLSCSWEKVPMPHPRLYASLLPTQEKDSILPSLFSQKGI